MECAKKLLVSSGGWPCKYKGSQVLPLICAKGCTIAMCLHAFSSSRSKCTVGRQQLQARQHTCTWCHRLFPGFRVHMRVPLDDLCCVWTSLSAGLSQWFWFYTCWSAVANDSTEFCICKHTELCTQTVIWLFLLPEINSSGFREKKQPDPWVKATHITLVRHKANPLIAPWW